MLVWTPWSGTEQTGLNPTTQGDKPTPRRRLYDKAVAISGRPRRRLTRGERLPQPCPRATTSFVVGAVVVPPGGGDNLRRAEAR